MYFDNRNMIFAFIYKVMIGNSLFLFLYMSLSINKKGRRGQILYDCFPPKHPLRQKNFFEKKNFFFDKHVSVRIHLILNVFVLRNNRDPESFCIE